MRVSGVIFDLDGTLGDTLPVCYAAFREVFRTHLGREFTDEEIHSRFGPSEEGLISALVTDGATKQAIADFFTHYEAEHRACPRPFDGAVETLAALREAGVRLAVVTGKGPRSAEISLRLLGLAPYFDFVEAGDPSGGVKPAAMRRALARWDLEGPQIAAVGDAPSDIRAAHEVGAAAIGAAWASTASADALLAERPTAVFDSFAKLLAWLRVGE